MATVKGTWVFNEKPQPYAGVGAAYIYSDTTPPTVYVGEAQTYGIAAYPAEGGFIPEILEDGVGIYMWSYSAAGESMYLYETESWKDESYRTVTFTEEVAVDDEAYAWLTANAVQQASESTHTVKGVWVLNETLKSSDDWFEAVEGVNFISNGTSFCSLADDGTTATGVALMYYKNESRTDYVMAYDVGKWANEAYRTIDFGEAEQEVSDEFYAWFTANAVQQPDEPAPTATFDLSTLNLPAGTHSITVKARASGYADSAESNAVSYVVEASVETYYDIIVYDADNVQVDAEDIYPNTIKPGETLDVTLEMVYGTGIESFTGAGAVVVESYLADGFFPGHGTFHLTVSNATDDVVIRLTNNKIPDILMPE